MKTTALIAMILIIDSLGASSAQANEPTPVERGSTVSVTMHFGSSMQSGSAVLKWQTFDDTAIRQNRDKGMALVFTCSGNSTQKADVVTVACTIPSDVADGNYYLVSASVGDGGVQRTYSWRGDLPGDVEMRVKGGPTTGLPNMKSIQISGTKR